MNSLTQSEREREEFARVGYIYVVVRFFLSAALCAAGLVVFVAGCAEGPTWLPAVGVGAAAFGWAWQWRTPPRKRKP